MQSQLFVRFTVCVGLAISIVSGCGSSPPPKPKTEQAAISGTVKIGDKPVPMDCDVIFLNSKEGVTIAAKTDSNGKFILAAADPRIGIPVGSYQVGVKPASATQPSVVPGSKEYRERMTGKQPVMKPEEAAIDKKFYVPAESGIVVEAKAGPNEFNIDLSKY